VREHDGVQLDLAHLPPDDPEVYRMLQAADTIGVFQVESRAQMATLPRMRPERFYDLVVEVAIIRPGPIVGQMVNPYLRRRTGREQVSYAHPSLEPILKRTLGVPLFQDQLRRMAMSVAGFTAGDAEELRRAMGFKALDGAHAHHRDQAPGGHEPARHHRRRAGRDRAVDHVLRPYGFPGVARRQLRAHRVRLGVPEGAPSGRAFCCGLLNAYPMGFYHPATLVKDGQRHGVRFSPPASNAPAGSAPWRTVPCGSGSATSRDSAGGRRATGRITAVRLDGDARSAAPPHARAGGACSRGALATFGLTRRDALWQAAAVEHDATSLLARVRPPVRQAPLPQMTAYDETTADYTTTSLTVGPHVMTYLRPALTARGVHTAAALARVRDGSAVRVAGHVIVRQRPGTREGHVCFLTLEDETGTANAFPHAATVRAPARAAQHVRAGSRCRGWEQRDGVTTHARPATARLAAPERMPVGHNYGVRSTRRVTSEHQSGTRRAVLQDATAEAAMVAPASVGSSPRRARMF
jgi:error-prone DNA polymerase